MSDEDFREQRRPSRLPHHGPAFEITFGTIRELEDYLAKHGRRISRWHADGTFDTEEIPRERPRPPGNVEWPRTLFG